MRLSLYFIYSFEVSMFKDMFSIFLVTWLKILLQEKDLSEFTDKAINFI